MPSPLRTHQIWVDIETTGLDIDTCIPLAVGMRLTDSKCNTLLEHTELVLSLAGLHMLTSREYTEQFVYDMHRNSSLLDWYSMEVAECAMGGNPVPLDAATGYSNADKSLWEWLDAAFKMIGCEPEVTPMFGSSVEFDRAFINKYLPRTAVMFHYRNISVSSMREQLYQLWHAWGYNSSELDEYFGEARGVHLPQPDIDDSIALYKKISNILHGGAEVVRGREA